MRYITPEHCIRSRLKGRTAPSWAAGVLVFRDHPHSQEALKPFDRVRPVRYRMLYNLTDEAFEPLVFETEVAGQTIAIVTRCVWGGPQTAIVVEELACLGVKVLIGCGVAGSLEADLPQGTFVVADSAIPTDGTSRSYGAATNQTADSTLVQAAIASAANVGCEMRCVTAVTVDALYRETPALIDDLRRRGGQIINMETSPLYTVSAACGVRSLWMGYISDCLVDGKWHDWFADLGQANKRAAHIVRIILERVLSE